MANEWISVKDRMPEDGQTVWIAREGQHTSVSGPTVPHLFIRDATYQKDAKYPFSGDGPSVRYWMPRPVAERPEPPESEHTDG